MNVKFLIVGISFILSVSSYSQTFSYCVGDIFYLRLDSYNGSLQWQQSSDSVVWNNISGANYSPYGLYFWGNKFYRAVVTNSGCFPVISSVQKTIENTVGCPPPTYPAGSVFCNGATAIVPVTNPVTGRIWMDRNLGATQVAISSTDANAYGDLYQWGRRSDGHQCRTSNTSNILSSIDQPANGSFILAPITPFDWRNPQNTNLWQGVNGVNNPCPTGYRIPTQIEWDNEILSWSSSNSAGAFASSLKLTKLGRRFGGNGAIEVVGVLGAFWSSSITGTNSFYLNIQNNGAVLATDTRSIGNAVRCIKE